MKEVQKNTQEKIRVEKRKYKGREFVDVRTYYLDDSGEWKPERAISITGGDSRKFSHAGTGTYWC